MVNFSTAKFGDKFSHKGKTYELVGRVNTPAVILHDEDGHEKCVVLGCPNEKTEWRKMHEIDISQQIELSNESYKRGSIDSLTSIEEAVLNSIALNQDGRNISTTSLLTQLKTAKQKIIDKK